MKSDWEAQIVWDFRPAPEAAALGWTFPGWLIGTLGNAQIQTWVENRAEEKKMRRRITNVFRTQMRTKPL